MHKVIHAILCKLGHKTILATNKQTQCSLENPIPNAEIKTHSSELLQCTFSELHSTCAWYNTNL